MKGTAVALFVVASLLFAEKEVWRADCVGEPVVRCKEHMKALEAAKDRMIRESHVIEHDKAGYDLYDTPSGRFWIPEGAKKSFMLPFNLAEQAVLIYGNGDQAIRRGDVVLDCGANVGAFTRLALDTGASKVIAVEPAPENLECFRRNFAAEINGGRVLVIPKGVWDKEDTLDLHVDPSNSAADSVVTQRPGSFSIKVPLTTIDHLVSELQLDRLDLIKLDIEGAEPNALLGATRTIQRLHPRLSVAAYHQPDHATRIPEIVYKARPFYILECGPCQAVNGKSRADVLWFH